VIEDQGIQRCLDPVADAEVFARLDVDDLQAPLFIKPDEIGAAGGEPVHPGFETVVAQKVDRDRDGRLVDRLARGEPGEEVETLLDGERTVGEGACPVRNSHRSCQSGADNLLFPADACIQEGSRHRVPVHRNRRDAGYFALLLRGRVIAEVAFAVVVEEPADERRAEVEAGHGRSRRSGRVGSPPGCDSLFVRSWENSCYIWVLLGSIRSTGQPVVWVIGPGAVHPARASGPARNRAAGQAISPVVSPGDDARSSPRRGSVRCGCSKMVCALSPRQIRGCRRGGYHARDPDLAMKGRVSGPGCRDSLENVLF